MPSPSLTLSCYNPESQRTQPKSSLVCCYRSAERRGVDWVRKVGQIRRQEMGRVVTWCIGKIVQWEGEGYQGGTGGGPDWWDERS